MCRPTSRLDQEIKGKVIIKNFPCFQFHKVILKKATVKCCVLTCNGSCFVMRHQEQVPIHLTQVLLCCHT